MFLDAENAVRAHIAALEAELATMRQLLVELTAGEKAGMTWDDWGPYCAYCDNENNPTYHTHTSDCPIVRGRALVQP